MLVQTEKKLFTVDDYYKMAEVGILTPNDRVELIHGEIIKMSPIKSPHAGIVNYLNRFLILNLLDKASIISQNPLRISDILEPEPDIMIAKYREDEYKSAHPRPEDVYCIIEVADSSLFYDRRMKRRIYAKAGITEYWIVNIRDQKLEIHTNLVNNKYKNAETLTIGDTAICTAIPFKIAVKDIF